MNTVQILVIGRNTDILETVLRLINNNPEWNATGTSEDGEAIRYFEEQSFDLVLLGGGIEPTSEESLCNFFRQRNPSIRIVQHYGGGSGLLSNEILHALKS